MKIVHISDIHLQTRYLHEYPHRFMGKRLAGLLNLKLNKRSHIFSKADSLIHGIFSNPCLGPEDKVVISGDLTSLGLKSEMVQARDLIERVIGGPERVSLIPGNHDLYTLDIYWRRTFEKVFAPYMVSHLPEYCVPGEVFPFVHFLGEHVALVCLNSARPNPLPWRSSGRIGSKQLEKVESLLADQRIHGKFVVIMTHYGPFLANGQPDTTLHGLVDSKELIHVLQKGKVGALIHGHIHHNFYTPEERVGFPIYCVGSSTYQGRASFNIYEVTKGAITGEVFTFDEKAERFVHVPYRSK